MRSVNKRNARVGISWCLDRLDDVLSVGLFVCVAPIIIIALCGLYEDYEMEYVAEMDAPADAKGDAEKLQFLSDRNGARAWLVVEGTAIDYPVMQASDNSWYLSRNYEGNFSGAGSLFLDWHNEAQDDA